MRELKRILYVEDEPDIRVIARLALATIGGFELKTCGSGQEALECLEAFQPDLLILDVMMPDMDGPSTLLALRALDKGGDVPVIFLTAKAQVAEVAGFKSLGALDVMSKPFDGMTLAKQVQAIWDQQAE